MIAAVAERAADIERLCGRHHVSRLALFGSAATGRTAPARAISTSWWSFRRCRPAHYADSYFGLLEDLERLLGGPVELVVGSAIRNPFFRRSVEQTSTLLYEA